MNKPKLKELLKRVDLLGNRGMVKIPHYENGVYKPISMTMSEACKLFQEQIKNNR